MNTMSGLVDTFHLEYSYGREDKFWRITYNLATLEAVVRWGRRGTDGQVKSYQGMRAKEAYGKTLESKYRKGYEEILHLRTKEMSVKDADLNFQSLAAARYPKRTHETLAGAHNLAQTLHARPWLTRVTSTTQASGANWTLFTTSLSPSEAIKAYSTPNYDPWSTLRGGAYAVALGKLENPQISKEAGYLLILTTAAGLFDPVNGGETKTLNGAIEAALLVHG